MRFVERTQRQSLLATIVLAAGLTITAYASPAVAAPKTAVEASSVNARNVTEVLHAAGKFRMEGPTQWIEEGSNGRKFNFVEEKRDASSVYLFDAGRNMRLQIALQQRQILILQGPSQWRPLYAITGASSAAAGGNVPSSPAAAREANPAPSRPGRSSPQSPGGPVSALNVKTVVHADGRFRLGSPRQWFEDGKGEQQFVWAEEKRTETSVFLSDDRRKMRLEIDLNRRQILFSQGTAPFSPLYPIANATAAAAVPPTMEQKCFDAVQGKIAWNRRGDKRWQPDNVRKLCGDTNLVGPAIECFEKELKNQGDTQRAIASCTEGRQQLQVVYVIPKGQQALPDADKALAAIMGVIQRHYFQELGATFELKSPLVSVIAIDETVEELKDLDGSTMFKRAQRLAANEYREDYEYRDNVIVFVFGGLQLGAGVGGANVAAIAAPFWRPAYDMFKRTPSDLPNVRGLHAWSHELGHAFGLMHTEDTRGCLKKFGVDLGTLPSLIMQKREDRPTVYDYPFMAEEKHLLLDEAYYSNCRPLLLKRSHASRHLRHSLPANSGSN